MFVANVFLVGDGDDNGLLSGDVFGELESELGSSSKYQYLWLLFRGPSLLNLGCACTKRLSSLGDPVGGSAASEWFSVETSDGKSNRCLGEGGKGFILSLEILKVEQVSSRSGISNCGSTDGGCGSWLKQLVCAEVVGGVVIGILFITPDEVVVFACCKGGPAPVICKFVFGGAVSTAVDGVSSVKQLFSVSVTGTLEGSSKGVGLRTLC